jgi:hypothetical protein
MPAVPHAMTSGSDWPAMRNNRYLLFCCVLLCTEVALTAEPAPAAAAPTEQPAADDRTRPERQFRPLPADTFTPSEEISEDFPVPFPVDI